jgi:hypothetical protein
MFALGMVMFLDGVATLWAKVLQLTPHKTLAPAWVYARFARYRAMMLKQAEIAGMPRKTGLLAATEWPIK